MKIESPHSEQSLTQESMPLMTWSLKTIHQPPRARKIVILAGLCPVTAISFSAIWSYYNGAKESYELDVSFIPAALIIGLILIAILRQKTIFNYRIYATYGEVDSCHYFPTYAGHLFKGVVIFAILMIIGVATYTGSMLILVFGPIALLLGAGGTLLSWTRPLPELETSLPWHEYKYVTVDRKYRIIVTHRTDLTLGYEARFADNAIFEQYLAFLKKVLPSHATFTEKVWVW